jgi:hypothetical protein
MGGQVALGLRTNTTHYLEEVAHGLIKAKKSPKRATQYLDTAGLHFAVTRIQDFIAGQSGHRRFHWHNEKERNWRPIGNRRAAGVSKTISAVIDHDPSAPVGWMLG